MIIESYVTEIVDPNTKQKRAFVGVVGGEVLLDLPFKDTDDENLIKTLVCAIRVLEQKLVDAGQPYLDGIV